MPNATPTPPPPLSGRCRVAVIAFDRISSFHLSIPCVMFGEAHPPPSPYDLVVCSADAPPLRTDAGFTLGDLAGLEAAETAEVLIVPSWRDVAERPPEPLLQALRAAHRRGARLVGLCLGTYVLAEAGLLRGRRATTHWEFAPHLAQRFPDIHVEPDVLYVEDGQVLTSAGTAAGLDACLHLLRRLLGARQANEVARRMVIPPHREGGQAQCIPQPLPDSAGGSRLAALIAALRERLHEPHSLDTLAREAHLSRRSLTRHFRALTGTTVQAWLLSERLQLAQQLLEQTETPIDAVAAQVGFGSPEALRLHFRRALGISPSRWRAGFRG
jgi:transcriptional regulator GlxA family with amidase domain